MCDYCNDSGKIFSEGKVETCIHCMTSDKFMSSLDRAIKECKDKEKKNNLKSVRSNLPDYPLVAKLEAEALGLSEKFIEMLCSAFDVKPFIDVGYKKVEVE